MIDWVCQQHHPVGCRVEPEQWVPVLTFGAHKHWLAQSTADRTYEVAQGVHSRLALQLAKVDVEIDLCG
ncbi:hypothetical protein [Nocardia sp. NPDC058633]|uniref:hypothetical protein n=1 Tax=Nocardia sp. NPDC058633 TaxID=3346568 RepID=UPI0036698C53